VLGTAWVVINPVPSGSDEPAHYIHALAAGSGHFTGPHAMFPDRDPRFPDAIFLWDQTSRRFTVPARIAPGSTFACTATNWTMPATCTSVSRCVRWVTGCGAPLPVTGSVGLVTYTGDYEPTFYVVPGITARLGANDVQGVLAARAGGLIVASALLLMAGLLLWEPRDRGQSMIGLLITATPMALYMNTVVNPNGGEIVASIAFAAAMLRIARDREATPPAVWIAAGVAGFLCGFSRVDGPVWVLMSTVTIVTLLGFRRALSVLRAGGRWAAVAVTGAAAGVAADLAWWHLVVGVPQFRQPASQALHYITDIGGSLPGFAEQMIGAFGWGEGDISAGAVTYIIWAVMVLVVGTLAMLVASRRERLVVSGLIAFDVCFTVVTGAVARVSFGFAGSGTLGRYLLPLFAITTLTLGEILRKNRSRLGTLSPTRLVFGVGLAAAACQAISLWMAARAYAVGTAGPIFFLTSSRWQPPRGWALWLVVATLGCLGIALFAWLSSSPPRGGAPLDSAAPDADGGVSEVRLSPG